MSQNITSSSSPTPAASSTSFLSPSSSILLLLSYLLLVRLLRYSRGNSLAKKLGYTDRASLKGMTNEDAQKIMSFLAELEFPKVLMTSLQFALFKTYGIPTISKLLVDTKQLSGKDTASKRYADTTVLIGEFTSFHPTHPRALKAIARMNTLHAPYQKAQQITQPDLLYTLSVFITEPITFINTYEWRRLTPTEICAIATFWKSIGDAMDISYACLPRAGTWSDGLEFYEDIKAWAEEYERKFMVPELSNKQTADALVPMLLFYVPGFALPFARQVVGVIMGKHLRAAMIYPDPSPLATPITGWIFDVRKILLRYLALPRPGFMRVREIADEPNEKGRYNTMGYLVEPYYNKPTFWSRWGPMAWVTWLGGGFVPDARVGKWMPEGYLLEEVGPERRKGKGLEEMREWEGRLERERGGGCPFLGGRK
ncbi:dephospho- kinase protein [Rutstroemia sp. NJR-2017a WRK4]|nr:dephospho- kinase protein [Rutstroemia sp. NJR-2017a WRK4]